MTLQNGGRRRMSLSEARRMALAILYSAEQRRNQTAIEEAKRGISYDHPPEN